MANSGTHYMGVLYLPSLDGSDSMMDEISHATRRTLRVCTVTPCHGRPDLVGKLLLSLKEVAKEDLGSTDAVDIIIVDSTPENSPAAEQIRTCCERVGAHYSRGPLSVRAKRNLGARLAHSRGADIVLFIDSDCQAQPGLFREHLAAYQVNQSPFTHRPIGAAAGVTEFIGPESAAFRAMAQTPFLDSFSFAQRMPEVPFAPCTNFSIRLDVFEQVGGFVETWDYRLGGDDTELGRRINNAGYAILSRPQAVVFHDKSTWNSWTVVLERVWRWGRMDINIRRAEPVANRQWIAPQFLTVALLFCPLAIVWGPIPFLLLIFSTVVLSPIITAVLRGPEQAPLADRIAGEFLVLTFQLGALYESLRSGHPLLFWQEIVTHPMQIGTSWDVRRRAAWVSILMLLTWLMLTLVTLNLARLL
jgi:GT2 family glycosyltransferase